MSVLLTALDDNQSLINCEDASLRVVSKRIAGKWANARNKGKTAARNSVTLASSP